MLGQKMYKNKAEDMDIYTQVAEWCNENGYNITDKGEYYEVVERDIIPLAPMEDVPTITDLVEALDILSNIVLGGAE